MLLLVFPAAIASVGIFNGSPSQNTHLLSPSNYSEGLSVYLTSTQSMWRSDLVGGNITLGISPPSSVSYYSITLTHYNSWNSQYEIFTKNGLGLIGASEPMLNDTLLTIDTSSQADANSLASSIGQKYGLNFVPFSTNSTTFSFVSPTSFVTEMHVFFWNLLPHGAGGFANLTTEANFESQPLTFFTVSYSSGSYSISFGGIKPLASNNKRAPASTTLLVCN